METHLAAGCFTDAQKKYVVRNSWKNMYYGYHFAILFALFGVFATNDVYSSVRNSYNKMLLVNDGKAFLKIENGNEVQNYVYAFFLTHF